MLFFLFHVSITNEIRLVFVCFVIFYWIPDTVNFTFWLNIFHINILELCCEMQFLTYLEIVWSFEVFYYLPGEKKQCLGLIILPCWDKPIVATLVNVHTLFVFLVWLVGMGIIPGLVWVPGHSFWWFFPQPWILSSFPTEQALLNSLLNIQGGFSVDFWGSLCTTLYLLPSALKC